MSLKTVVLISFCLFSLTLASVEETIKKNGFKSVLEMNSEGSLKLDEVSEPAVNKITDESLNLRSKLLASVAKNVAPRVTIDGSNLPPLTQVAVADCLKLAYEYQDTDAARIDLFVALVSEVVPSYEWNVVLDYQHLYYTANYYIRLKTDSGDLVFAFSSNV